MHYINQLNYPHLVYHTNAKRDVPAEEKINTVKAVGCGLCCACMVVNSLTPYTLNIEDCVKISESCGANPYRGTNMSILAPVIAEKYDLVYTATDDLEEAIAHLQKGGQIIVHTGIPEGQEIGLFTQSGHYILAVSTDGKEFCILDPEYSPGKFDIPKRSGKVDDSHAPYLYCDVNIVDSETKPGKTKYHLFARNR